LPECTTVVIKIRIAAPPVENAANRALIDFVAQHLGNCEALCARRFRGHQSQEGT